MVKHSRVLKDAEFAVLRKWACVRCKHFGYCPSCDKLECSLGLRLTEGSCGSFVRNFDVQS